MAKTSAGLVIKFRDEILLIHPTNAPWKGTYQFPKGLVEEGETYLEAALRETEEEIGVRFDENMVKDKEPGLIEYRDKKGKLYKRVYYFIVEIVDISILKYIYPTIPKGLLQLDEVDWGGFLHKDVAKEKIFWRFLPILENIFE